MVVTLLYAGVLAALHVVLAEAVLRTYVLRMLNKNDDAAVQKAQRVHANFAEYVPHALLMIGLLEMGGAPRLAIHGLGSLLVLGRVLHVWGMYMKQVINPARTSGTQITMFVLLASGVGAIFLYWAASGP